jgi:homoserine kinase
LAPAFYGGFTVAVDAGDHPSVVCFPPPAGLRAVVLTPSLTISTYHSRASLPINVSHKDASYNVGRACLLVASLLANRFEMLRIAMEDRLHQPYRAGAYPAMMPIIEAAKATGAAGAALSGSGPSIIALCDGATEPVVEAMQRAAFAAGLDARTRELDIVPVGASVSTINS